MHTYIRLRGFGYGIVPYAPYLVRRLGDDLVGCMSIEACGQRAHVNPRLPEVAETLAAVAEVHEVPGPDEWLIDFGPWTVPWPNEFSLLSPETDNAPFLLHGCSGLIWVQGPFDRIPAEEDCIAPGQAVVARGTEDGFSWLELQYEEQGRQWLQRHHFLPRQVVLTMQEPHMTAGAVSSVAMVLAEQLTAQLLSD